jgi:carbon-monoxide dehydrogenase medium subunit
MTDWQRYLQPEKVEDALAALDSADGKARLVAGGTDLLLDIQQGRHPPVEVLVDVAGIGEMRTILVEGDVALIGAAIPHAVIVEHPVLQARATALTEACGLIGGPQVRVVATLGGNVAHALPAADGTIALLALDAQAEVASIGRREWLPLSDLFAGPGQTTFDRARQVLVRFRVPLTAERQGSAFARIMRPQGVAIAILNMGCWIELASSGGIAAIRLACGPAGPTPRRCTNAEAALVGVSLSAVDWDRAAQALLSDVRFRTSPHRATSDYRRHLAGSLLRRVVEQADARASGVVSP